MPSSRDRRAVSAAASGTRLPVLLVNTPTLSPIGADTWIHVQVIRALDRSRFDVHVACMKGPPDAPAPMYTACSAIPDIELVEVNFGREHAGGSRIQKLRQALGDLPAVLSFARLAVYVRRNRIPIIHTVSRPRDALACVLLARLTRKKCLIHMQLGFAEWMSRSLRWALRHADGLVSISEFVTSTLVDNGVDPKRIHLAYNIVVFDDWQPGVDRAAAREELGTAADAPVVVTVCRLFPAKGTLELLRALAIVRDEIPDVRLVVVGRDVTGGSFTVEMNAVIAAEGLEDCVVFAGQRSDIDRMMAAADVFSMPSIHEPFGIVFAEAMTMELPVVALDNGGTPEVVGPAGLLSETGDIETLAANLISLLRDPPRRAELGAIGRQRVKNLFTAEHLANEMGRIYESVAQ